MLTVEVRLNCNANLLLEHLTVIHNTHAHIWPGLLIGETGQLRAQVTRRVFYSCESTASDLGLQIS